MADLPGKIVTLHDSLDRAAVPHAFGGALALAYCTEEPRGTADIDLNVFVGPERARAVLSALPDGVAWSEDDVAAVDERGQVRVWWADVPVDLFFGYHAVHARAARRAHLRPFAGTMIPVLSCTDLLLFKVAFARTKDWADIEAMASAGAVDEPEALALVDELFGPDDGRGARLREALATGAGAADERTWSDERGDHAG